MTDKELLALQATATQCRLNVLRMLRASHHGHIGGAFSAMDVVTALYFYKMHIDPKDPAMKDRDRFILSAGHKCLCQYAALAEKGYFDKSVLDTYGSLDARIPGHPNMHELPGVEANTGALGHGLSIAVGMALGLRLDKSPANVYVVTGDGELPEGSNWEAAAAAAHHKLCNLTAFVDNNGLQISGRVEDVMNMTPIADKFRSFGWSAIEIDGNDMDEIVKILDMLPLEHDKPTAVIMHTVKSKGLSFGEGDVAYHYWKTTDELMDRAEKELGELLEEQRKGAQA
jgi:transketolase